MKTLIQLAAILIVTFAAGEFIHWLAPIQPGETIPVNKALLAVAFIYFWQKQDKN